MNEKTAVKDNGDYIKSQATLRHQGSDIKPVLPKSSTDADYGDYIKAQATLRHQGLNKKPVLPRCSTDADYDFR